jgi:hypothetical protein
VIGWLYMALGVLAAVMSIFVPTGVFILLLLQAGLLIAVGAGLVAGRLWAYYVAVVMAAFDSVTPIHGGRDPPPAGSWAGDDCTWEW